MDLCLNGKRAVVTGGASGIGYACCKTLTEEGVQVIIADVNIEAAEKAKESLTTPDLECFAYHVDTTDEQSVKEIFEYGRDKIGPIDILVNSAGIVTISKLVDLEQSGWDKVMNVNAKGIFLCMREYFRCFGKNVNSGKIVNISSQAGKAPVNLEGHYSASKAAVNMLTKAFAMEGASLGINVNAVCPGSIESVLNKDITKKRAEVLNIPESEFLKRTIKNTPLGRQGTVEEVSWLVAFLCSEKADFMTGQTINITGGRILH